MTINDTNNNTEKSFFYIAIVPSLEICEKINHFKQLVSEQFDCQRSLKHIPHITLVPPFHINSNLEQDLDVILTEFSSHCRHFEIQINDFSHFKKHTLFMNVLPSEELNQLHFNLFKKLNESNLLTKPIHYFQKYNPHITIAYRDLEPKFNEVWNYFKEQKINLNFINHSFSLLKHNGEKWEVFKNYY